jgi:hypothetical protein
MTFKICRNCGTKASLRARKCKPCGVPAIWDKPTPDQIEAERMRNQRMAELAAQLLAEWEDDQ